MASRKRYPVNIANSDQAEFFADNKFVREGPLWRFNLGAYGDTVVFVWADSADSAMEIISEWIDDNMPGMLSWAESEEDEVDMYVVGHTTLEHGNIIPSWEINFTEVPRTSRLFNQVVRVSLAMEGN